MDFIPVKTFDSYITANIWLGRLQDQEIDCYLKDEYTVTIDPILSNAIGGIKLCISSEQLEKGMDLIRQFEAENKQALQCPACNSMNVEYVTKPGNPIAWLGAIATWLLGSYALSANQVYHCFDCRHDFKEIAATEVQPLNQ